MDDLLLRLKNGTQVVVPPSLGAITTYALLEQETWFEKELGFLPHIVTPGMTVIDIGANLGVYSIAMAKLVGENGRVFAFEPTSATRDRLETSRQANALPNLEIVGRALSDSERLGRIVFGGSSEVNHLGADGEGETVEISSLDIESRRLGWNGPDFIKIDAEGEEEAIIRGAEKLFNQASPIVMMEIRAEATLNSGLVGKMAELAYAPYRLVPGMPLLVPLDVETLDGFELNFFAIKPDRSATLAENGLLLEANPAAFELTENEITTALSDLRAQPFAKAFPAQFGEDVHVDPTYERVLAAYHVWRHTESSLSRRWAALRYATTALHHLVNRDSKTARLSTLARIAGEFGMRGLIQPTLKLIVESIKAGPIQLGEPFWPPCSRYDAIRPGANPGQWFLAAVTEQLERDTSLSSVFVPVSEPLPWLCGTPFATAEMHRRLCLDALRRGKNPSIPQILLEEGPDNLNAALWRDGTISRLALR